MKNKKLTKEIISEFTSKYGKDKLRILEIPVDDSNSDFFQILVRIPDRNTMTQFMRFIENSPKKAQDILINQCVLTGKEQIEQDDAMYMSAVSGIAELFPIRQAVIKNL